MGYLLEPKAMNAVFKKWNESYTVYAPAIFPGGGRFADTDTVRYKAVQTLEDIVFDRKSAYSFKEALLPITQTLFYFTEDTVKEADFPQKGAVIFLRSCDLHAVERLDEIYLRNGFEDYYYKTIRERVKFVLMGCEQPFESCFCTDMGSNRSDSYDCSIEIRNGTVYIDNKNPDWDELFTSSCKSCEDVSPSYAADTKITANIPEAIGSDIITSPIWDEYDLRCINCGRCSFVCPTCTCFTMQDIFYTDNGKVGERRRVWASCMTDGFTDMAGGHSYRQKNGQRIRFRALHKISDYKKRTGKHMCVGCGRCDDICPEYISFSHCIGKIENACREVSTSAAK